MIAAVTVFSAEPLAVRPKIISLQLNGNLCLESSSFAAIHFFSVLQSLPRRRKWEKINLFSLPCLDNLFKFRLVLPVRREGWWRGEALIVNKNCRRPDNFDNYRIKRDGRVEPVPPAPRGQSRVEASARLRFFDHPETLLALYTINSLDPAPISEILQKQSHTKSFL